jgi:(4S)-4-hydroxy-5-phosphonooxypentane-2,3-dione isomerase
VLTTSSLAVVVRFVVKAGAERSFFERVVRQAGDSLRHEPQCRQFDVCVDPADPSRILLYEIYDSEAAFAEHLDSAHFRAFDAETRAWVSEKAVERWHRPGNASAQSDEDGR